MFGTKLRSWMEAHIVRSKKKKERKKGEKGSDSNCNSPRSHGSNRSPALYQVHPVDPVAKNVDGIRLHGEGGRCGTVSASSATSAGTGSVSLSSPESAYSTGYSTDGTSPGTSYPPEYYINIRTGTHYFQRNANATANANAVTVNTINNNNSNCNNNNSGQNRSKRPFGTPESPGAAPTPGRRHGRFDASVDPVASTCGTAYVARNASMDNDLSNDLSNGLRTSAHSKIVERLGNNDGARNQRTRSQAHRERCHRRTESFSAESSRSNLAGASSSVPPSLLSPTTQSPRERSRIRTNPWLSTNSSSSCTASFKYRLNLDDTSSGSGLRLTESSGSASDVNASVAREDRTQRELKQESLSAGRSPINQNWRIASGMEIRPKVSLSMQRRNSTSSSSSRSSSASPGPSNGSNDRSGGSSSGSNGSSRSSVNGNENGNEKGNDDSSAASITRSVRSSEDDITLNEMMGKFDESYVYEKETDILSDSDPTDCEDYIESPSDVDAVRDGDGDERLDNDDLDYIDNGSFLDLHDLDCADRFTNTGHCTYFAFTGELARRASRLRESLMKRRNREDTAMPHRTIVAKSASRKQLPRHRRPTDELLPGEKRKKKSSQRRKSNLDKRDQDSMTGSGPGGLVVEDDEEETGNLNRVLVERMLLKNSGFNQGSRSVGGTPICMRRKKHDVNRNLSPMRSHVERPSAVRPDIGDPEIVDKRRSNSVSYVNGNVAMRRLTTAGNPYMTTFASEIALLEADKEADRKYRELILEAENILANMQKSHTNVPIVPSPSRKFYYGLANKRVELIKNTELNIELALSKSRNSQPELQSGSIRDLEHTSPKRQQLVQSSSPFQRFQSSPVHRASPLVARREQSLEIQEAQRDTPLTSFNRNGVHVSDAGRCVVRPQASLLANVFSPRDSPCSLNRTEYRVTRPSSASVLVAKEEGVTSSSSDSEDRCDVRRRPPLMTFRSVDMGPIKEGSSYCPQSEPVKRKVYAGSSTYGRIQKTLGENVTLRNSDGDTATDPDTDDSRRSLKEKVAKLRRERLDASPNGAPQESQIFQQQLSQLRRQMLVQTIQGLKRSLEDQSATLKQSCLEPMMADRLP